MANFSCAGQLLGKVFLLSLPAWVLAVSYFVLDPFWVLYHYPTFSDNLITIPNRDYVSTQMYLNTYQQRRYRSFILGNSRTLAFRVRDWSRYTHDSAAFHFDASSESLFGVWKKLQFLEAHSPGIRNVLIVCDPSLLSQTQDVKTHLARKDPRLTGELPFSFQLTFFQVYFSNHFYAKYLKRRLTGKYTPDMATMMEHRRVHYDPQTNDLTLPDLDEEIRADSAGYYARNKDLTPRLAPPPIAPAAIGAAQLRQLVAVHNIFERNHTNYNLVLSPLYQQQQVNPADVALLVRLFGAGRVHDFSGVNQYTRAKGNYYEEYHYRPVLGRQLLRAIYAPDSTAEVPRNKPTRPPRISAENSAHLREK